MVEKNNIVIKLGDVYEKKYKMRLVGASPGSVEATIPKIFVEKEAKKHGMNCKEFVKKFVVEWSFNSFEGVHCKFIKK